MVRFTVEVVPDRPTVTAFPVTISDPEFWNTTLPFVSNVIPVPTVLAPVIWIVEFELLVPRRYCVLPTVEIGPASVAVPPAATSSNSTLPLFTEIGFDKTIPLFRFSAPLLVEVTVTFPVPSALFDPT